MVSPETLHADERVADAGVGNPVTELFQLLFVEGNPAGVKSMLALMGFIENVLRLPLVPNTIKTYEKIRLVLRELNATVKG